MHKLHLENMPIIEFPLMDEIGTLLTKSKSVNIEKRYRDSLDIYLAISQNQNYVNFIDRLKSLKSQNPYAFNNLYGIREAFEKFTLYSNSIRFHEFNKTDFDNVILSFMKDIKLDKPATN